MNKKISAAIICKNEEQRIRQCLQSLAWVDEIVLLDSGSTDRTLEIAREYTDRIYINTDWKGFGPQKKLAESYTTNDWVLAIDSDEIVSDALRDEVVAVLDSADEKTVFRLNRLTYFCGKFIRHSGWHPDRIVRLYNKKHYHYNDAYVHEAVSCVGARKVDLREKLLHYQVLSLEDYIDKRNSYAKAWADAQYAKGRTTGIAEIFIRSFFAFFRHYIIRLGVLDGYHGVLISIIQMQYTFNKYNFLKFRSNTSVHE
jgi:(heptosyl)LPS beta-1,4-glucosyltransferase